jgi:hypothetical protein
MFQKDSVKMQSVIPTLMMAVFGLIFLVQMLMAVPGASQQVAVIVPPWAMGGMGLAARLNMPIVDLRWQGHVIILDVSKDPMAVSQLQNAGFFLIKTDVQTGCRSVKVA